MVNIMEIAQAATQEESTREDLVGGKQPEGLNPACSSSQWEDRPTISTPVPEVEASDRDESLVSLEANLQVATTSKTPLTELLPVHTPDAVESEGTNQQHRDVTTSSLYDAASMSEGTSEVRFLTDPSEEELTEAHGDSQDIPPLYAGIPQITHSGTEGGDASGWFPTKQTKLVQVLQQASPLGPNSTSCLGKVEHCGRSILSQVTRYRCI